VRVCDFPGCERGHYARGLCNTHWRQWRDRPGQPLTPIAEYVKGGGTGECTFPECTRRAQAKGLCRSHHRQLTDGRELRPLRPIGPRGSGTLDSKGYRRINRKAQHRQVMEDYLGRPLLPEETVHHRNGERADNRIENLELWSRSHPAGQRVEDKIQWALELLALYEGFIPPHAQRPLQGVGA
jgi:hypothetical protein